MQAGPRVIGRGLQLSLFMNVRRSPPETKREPLAPGKYPEPLSWLGPRNGLGRGREPFRHLLQFSIPLWQAKVQAWHAGPAPSCQHARLFHSPPAFAAPSTGNTCQAVLFTWPNLSSPSRGPTHVTSSLEPVLNPTAELATPSSTDSWPRLSNSSSRLSRNQ